MKLAILAVGGALLMLGAAAPAGPACAQTCHDTCSMRCHELYPTDPSMQMLCTYSCIQSECGGTDWP